MNDWLSFSQGCLSDAISQFNFMMTAAQLNKYSAHSLLIGLRQGRKFKIYY